MASTLTEHAELLRERFVLQDQVFVTQWKNEDRAGYKKVVNKFGKELPLTLNDIVKHIKGEQTVGVYQLKEDMVKTLCLDIDTPDRELAQKQTLIVARFIYKMFGKESFLVEDSGSKGYHVWVFFDPPVSASLALRIGRYIHNNIEILDDVGIEVFPKQDTTHGGYGNLVKLPWGINLKTDTRCVFVNGKFEQIENQYDALKFVFQKSIEDEEAFCRAYNIPEIERSTYEPGDKFLCMTTMMADGLIEGHRDVGFHKLATFLRQNGLPMDYTEMIMHEANERSHPPAARRDVDEKIQNTYRNQYFVSPCKEPGLDVYCSPACALFERKAQARGVTVEQLQRIVGRR